VSTTIIKAEGSRLGRDPVAESIEPRKAGAKLRMLLIVNPRATTVSGRLKNLVVYALRGRYDVRAVETESPNHATALTREAIDERYDVVVAFGGDGTANEVANGLAGTTIPLTLLPGGCTNVACRMLGIPTDVVDATEHLLQLADQAPTRAIDLGRVDGRYFLFSSGAGLDADAARWVDERPPIKARGGVLSFTYAASLAYLRHYRGRPPRLCVEAQGERVEGVSALVQNSQPFTYFRSKPLHVCEDVSLDSGTISLLTMRRAGSRDAPGVVWRLFRDGQYLARHPQARSFTGLLGARVTALESEDGHLRPFPLEVDGDFLGEFTDVTYEVHPRALRIVA
jgi:diacylglycerol kinase family enzyme